MMIELKREDILAVSQSSIKVFYDGEVIGEYYADILVDNKVIVEIKAAKRLVEENEAQVLNYLKATDIEVGQPILKLDFYLILVLNQRLNVRHLIIQESSSLRGSAKTCPPSGRRVCVPNN
jgi:hypothetical protein